MRHILTVLIALVLLTPAAFAAPSKAPVSVEVSPINDPIEPFNRAVFQFNRFVDFLVLKPITTAYDYVVPSYLRHSVTSFLNNLGAPIDMLNNLLQGDWYGLGNNAQRFAINSTMGVLGLVDVATDMGIEQVSADFGQTLGKWGAGQGFYLVLPILGPSSLRDGTGRVVDAYADPYNQIFMDSETEWPIYARAGLTIVDTRSRYGAEYDRTMKTAVDPYVTFRSIYAQRRAYVVQGGTSKEGALDAYSAAEAQ